MENTLFPGRPDYIGPTSGWFGLLHHQILFEKSHSVMERVEYVKARKPALEIATRLHNMIYLGGCEAIAKHDTLDADYIAKRDALYADYVAKRAPLDADYYANLDALYVDYVAKRAPLYADYVANRAALDTEILIYIRSQIPDCAWNGAELVFPTAKLKERDHD